MESTRGDSAGFASLGFFKIQVFQTLGTIPAGPAAPSVGRSQILISLDLGSRDLCPEEPQAEQKVGEH